MLSVATYRSASPSEKKKLQIAAVREFEPLAQLVARSHPRRRTEAAQLARLGVLVALEKFDPSRGVPFERLAARYARSEIRRWQAAR
jgi:DNA-directed RNA polymerase specialized sigma subunit